MSLRLVNLLGNKAVAVEVDATGLVANSDDTFIHGVRIGKVTVAGDVEIRDSAAGSGTVLQTLALKTALAPNYLPLGFAVENGLYVTFTGSAAGKLGFTITRDFGKPTL